MFPSLRTHVPGNSCCESNFVSKNKEMFLNFAGTSCFHNKFCVPSQAGKHFTEKCFCRRQKGPYLARVCSPYGRAGFTREFIALDASIRGFTHRYLDRSICFVVCYSFTGPLINLPTPLFENSYVLMHFCTRAF